MDDAVFEGFEEMGGREGEESDRGVSRLGREEEVGVEMRGIRRPEREGSRGLAMVDIVVVYSMIRGI